MKIEAFLAARVELSFALWSALISVDGAITWSAANTIGRAPRFTLREAQYHGALQILKKLRTLREQKPDASLTFFTDSQALVAELKGEWAQSQRGSSANLDACADLVRSLAPLTLRYCWRTENLPAHELISDLCRRHGVPVSERYVRER